MRLSKAGQKERYALMEACCVQGQGYGEEDPFSRLSDADVEWRAGGGELFSAVRLKDVRDVGVEGANEGNLVAENEQELEAGDGGGEEAEAEGGDGVVNWEWG